MSSIGIETTEMLWEKIETVTGTETLENGLEVSRVETLIRDTVVTIGETMLMDSSYTTWRRLGEDGHYSYLDPEDADSVEFIPFPLEEGNRWELSRTPPIIAEVVLIGETVTVPAGTFTDCVGIRMNWSRADAEFDRLMYLAPGVGMVKCLYSQTTGNIEVYIESELTFFEQP